MKSLNKWSDQDCIKFEEMYFSKGFSTDLAQRTYSSRLLGSDPELVLHGGGNTSVKTSLNLITGEQIEALCVKGSGWDLATIEPEGHPAVRLDELTKLKNLKTLSDEDMVAIQRRNLLNPNSPNPSVETLLHAFLPEKFIDHTHSIAILSIANQENALEICDEIYGKSVAIVPYVMPGFDLALKASAYYEEARRRAEESNTNLEGMILLKHGIFSFASTAKESYSRMINLVDKANKFLQSSVCLNLNQNRLSEDLLDSSSRVFPFLRGIYGKYSKLNGTKTHWIFHHRCSDVTKKIVNQPNIMELSKLGVATPDHVIRTKERPLVLDKIPEDLSKEEIDKWQKKSINALENYIEEYKDYFFKNNNRLGKIKICLDPLPRFILIPELGIISVGKSLKEAKVVADIAESWASTILSSFDLNKYKPISQEDLFEMEYWSLEQAKLGKTSEKIHSRKIVAITGGAGTIGSAIAKEFSDNGAEIVLIDKDKEALLKASKKIGDNCLIIECDLRNPINIEEAFKKIRSYFGGLDIMILNAGVAIPGTISNLDDDKLRESFEINFFSQQKVSQEALKIFQKQDSLNEKWIMGGQLLFNISKQALNPGKGFGAYGLSKAALLGLMKQYSLEEGENGIRSNGINADRIKSGILTQDMIKKRSEARGLNETEYMEGNLLKSEVTAIDVAKAFLAISQMEKTTGALITVDGGNVAAMVR